MSSDRDYFESLRPKDGQLELPPATMHYLGNNPEAQKILAELDRLHTQHVEQSYMEEREAMQEFRGLELD